MIDLKELEEMFASIVEEAGWDMNQPMLWGYFFTDGSEEKLAAVIPELEGDGYRLVDLFEADAEEGEPPYFILHVEREEVHSPVSLHEQNARFDAFAQKHGLESYDGMDVGPIAPEE